MDSLEILFCPTGTGRWRALVLRRPRDVVVPGFDTLGAAFDLDAPNFRELETLAPQIGYHRRELPDGTIRVTFPPSAVPTAVAWLQRSVSGRFESTG